MEVWGQVINREWEEEEAEQSFIYYHGVLCSKLCALHVFHSRGPSLPGMFSAGLAADMDDLEATGIQNHDNSTPIAV